MIITVQAKNFDDGLERAAQEYKTAHKSNYVYTSFKLIKVFIDWDNLGITKEYTFEASNVEDRRY